MAPMPRVACSDLLRLKELLRRAAGEGGGVVVENQHRSLIGKGDADEKVPALPPLRATGTIPSTPQDAELADSAPRGPAESNNAAGANAAGASYGGSGVEGKGDVR